MKSRFLLSAAAATLLPAAWASAGPVFNFYRISTDCLEDVGGQLSVEVNDASSGKVDFLFRNDVGIASSITDVYFDDGTLLGIAEITASAGVSFAQGASPGNLSGGNNISPAFVTTAGFSADSDPPVEHNGVDALAEWLTIQFTLIDGKTYAQTLAAIADGSLRIGLHVQAIGECLDSDSYVNRTVVPLPAAAWMGLALLGSVGGASYLRKRRRLAP